MKPVLFIIFLFTILTASSQSKTKVEPEEKSKLETFTLKTGSLIKKEFIDVGKAGKVNIQILHVSDLVAGTKISGVKLEMVVSKTYGSDTKSCFLDTDEIDGFVKAGKLLLSTLNENGVNYVEYQFTSRDGFQAGAYQSKKEWRYFLQLEKYDRESNVFVNKEEFQEILNLIETAKGKL